MIRREITLFLILISLLINSINSLSVIALEGSWIQKTSMSTQRSGLGVAVVNGKIYAIGGSNQAGFLNTNEEYDPTTNKWTTKKSMPTARGKYGITIYQNKIYCFGGYTEEFSIKDANEVYDPATNTWKTLAPMPTPRMNIQANTINQKIYIISGDHPSKYHPLNIIQVYDPATNTWETKKSIPTPVSTYVSAVVENKIYIITSKLTQIYNVENDSWSLGTPPAYPILHASARTIIDKLDSENILVFGVDDDLPELHCGVGSNPPYLQIPQQDFVIQFYYPKTDHWILYDSVPNARFSTSVAVFNDSFFVIGGYTVEYLNNVLPLNKNYIYSKKVNQYTLLESIPQTTITDPQPIHVPSNFEILIIVISVVAFTGLILKQFKKYKE